MTPAQRHRLRPRSPDPWFVHTLQLRGKTVSDYYFERSVQRKLDRILALLGAIQQEETNMAAELDALTAQVTANTDAEASAALLLKGLKDRLDAAIASGNPAALTALSAALGTSQAALAAAITANTPAP